MKEVSLYIHIPFCKQRCFYCDFPTFSGKDHLREEYVDALIKEIRDKCTKYLIKTIFIGGGTPSYLGENELEKLLKTVSELNLSKNIEYSMECNPGTVNEEKLKIMKKYGVNRISFGLQSCNDELLKNIGRIHTFKEFLENYKLARKIGFDNINIDLMYALPNHKKEEWKESLDKIISLNPSHISAYSLILEEGTKLHEMYDNEEFSLLDEDTDIEMYNYTINKLKENGYNQYEISNYSKEYKECKHNIIYWKCDNYLGLGPGASGYIGDIRYNNISDLNEYNHKISQNIKPIEEETILSEKDKIEEFIFMGLRMNEGISLKVFKERFNISIEDIYKEPIEKLIDSKLLELDKDNLKLTQKGREISNTVFIEFIN